MDLLPALREEWAGLEFGADRKLINPLTGEHLDGLRLISARHRQVGAVYRVSVTTEKYELPAHRRAEFDKDARELSRRSAGPEDWRDHARRRREQSLRVGVEEARYDVRLRDDAARSLAFAVTDDTETWVIDVEVEHARHPHVELEGRIDVSAWLMSMGVPRALARFLGGAGAGRVVVDAGSLEKSGTALLMEGRAKRFRVSTTLDVRSSARRWAITGWGVVRARGLGHPVLWIAGRRFRKLIERAFEELWTSSEERMAVLELTLRRLTATVAVEGGSAQFVRRALWDDGFDPCERA